RPVHDRRSAPGAIAAALRTGDHHQRRAPRERAQSLALLRTDRRPEAGYPCPRRRPWRHPGTARQRTQRHARTSLAVWRPTRYRDRKGTGLFARCMAANGDDPMISVCLVDDQTLVRQGIRSLLELSDSIRVVAEA